MALTRLSTKGQVVLPKEVRDTLGLTSGAEMHVEVRDGTVILRPVRKTTADDLLGILPWGGRAKTLDEMDEAVAKGARESR